MKRTMLVLAIAIGLFATTARAHPGSGIVVDKFGNVYFVDTGSGIWKVDRAGKLSRVAGPAYHWMAIDAEGRLKNARLPYFSSGGATVERAGTNPTLLMSSDFPVTVGRDGALFYPWMRSGQLLQIFRLDPSGATTTLATLSSSSDSTELRWVNGATTGPDGSLYYSEDAAVRKIDARGVVTTVAANLSVTPCEPIPGSEPASGPYLRGLDVDRQGSVYVAAASCGAVLKIAPDGKITTILRSSSPWSPTGVAVYGDEVFVLEYLHTPGDDRREWIPRVRKISADGRVTTIATIDHR